MTEKTQQKILKALHRLFSDLENWLSQRGKSEAEMLTLYVSVMKENGLMAQIVKDKTTEALPLSAQISPSAEAIVDELRHARSGKYAEWLLRQPEPDPIELAELLRQLNDALANVRKLFSDAAAGGPQYRHGHRPRELEDAKTRLEIVAKIKARRGPGTTLGDIFKSVAKEYRAEHSAHRKSVSPSKIKQIWLADGDKVSEDSSK